jgi:hypothetical protein
VEEAGAAAVLVVEDFAEAGADTKKASESYHHATSSSEMKPVAPAEDKWEFEVIPYFWMAGLNGDVTRKGVEAKVIMIFSDSISDVKFGGQAHFEANKRADTRCVGGNPALVFDVLVFEKGVYLQRG